VEIPAGVHTVKLEARRYSGGVSANTSYVDNFKVSMPSFYSKAVERTDDGYANIPWLGWVYDGKYPWVYDYLNGWMWISSQSNGMIWWDVGSEAWYWSSDTTYPYAYLYGEGWVWIGAHGDTERAIYHYSDGSWQVLKR
jgi:hypothetical protein